MFFRTAEDPKQDIENFKDHIALLNREELFELVTDIIGIDMESIICLNFIREDLREIIWDKDLIVAGVIPRDDSPTPMIVLRIGRQGFLEPFPETLYTTTEPSGSKLRPDAILSSENHATPEEHALYEEALRCMLLCNYLSVLDTRERRTNHIEIINNVLAKFPAEQITPLHIRFSIRDILLQVHRTLEKTSILMSIGKTSIPGYKYIALIADAETGRITHAVGADTEEDFHPTDTFRHEITEIPEELQIYIIDEFAQALNAFLNLGVEDISF